MDSSLNEHASGSLEPKNVAKKRALSQNNGSSKRQKKNTNSSLCVTPFKSSVSGSTSLVKEKQMKVCNNLACEALLRKKDTFCRRCSCFICHKFDENKDTSLWLTCGSDPPFDGESCGFSWHLDCSFKNKKSGVTENKSSYDLDGCFSCVSCGKTNSLLECLKKQLVIAKETKNIELLLSRIRLAYEGIKKYQGVESLGTEFGGRSLSSSMRRGNVNKHRFSTEVNNLCCFALKLLDDQPSSKMQRSTKIIFEDVGATSVTLVLDFEGSSSSKTLIRHKIWHRMASGKDYPKDLTCELFIPNTRFVVSKLTPATEYCFKVVSFYGAEELSVDELKVFTQEEGELNAANGLTLVEQSNNLSPHPHAVESKGKMVSLETDGLENDVEMEKLASFELELKQCVNVLRQLECSGLIEKEFRLKFLTWFSLRATPREALAVKNLIDGFKDDDPIEFAGQLVNTFSDIILRKPFAFGGGNGGGDGGASGS